MSAKTMTSTFFVSGLHCASCRLLIEKKLLKIADIKSVNVSLKSNTLTVKHYSSAKLSSAYLNQIFKNDIYSFSSNPKILSSASCSTDAPRANFFPALIVSTLIIILFFLISQTGIASIISINSESSLPLFLVFGILAGFSTCAALTGSILLSLSRQWQSLYQSSDSLISKLQPHFLFNAGRLISYTLLGALLGQLGNFFRLSSDLGAVLVIVVSFVMIILSLQMLGIRLPSLILPSFPPFINRHFTDETHFKGKYSPAIMGAFTFFLPCGFTITAQALALASGYPLQGALIMGLFALGTLPGLLAIGLASVKFQSARFSQVAGFLVLFFALFNINSQLAVLDLPNTSTLFASSTLDNQQTGSDSLPPINNGYQIVKMKASANGYSPDTLTVRAGIPVRWEITDIGTSGCTNAIIARSLFSGRIDLVPGTTSVKEFTIKNPGTYRFSCWMGMISGTITAVN